GVHLVDQDLRRFRGPAIGGGIDDPERVEERVDDVDDEQKERRRRQQREHDRQEALDRAGAVDRGGFDQRFGNRLQPRQAEQEVVADLFPDGRDHHHDQRVGAVQKRIPRNAETLEPMRDDAERRVEQEQPENRGHRRRDRVRPDQQRLVDGGAADHAVGEHGEDQRQEQAARRNHHGKDRRDLERREVVLVVEEIAEILEPDELRVRAERVLHEQRLVERLRRRPEEEDERDDELRRDQRI